MKSDIPPAYVVYLYGHLFASTSRVGHKHVVSGSRLNPIQLRKAIKMAALVSLYNLGIIDFEIRTEKGIFRKREALFVKLLKNIESSDFMLEKELAGFLKEKEEAELNFSVPKQLGFGYEDKAWMDHTAEELNKELAEKGYLKEKAGSYTPNEEAIKPLESLALKIKSEISEFEAKRTDLMKKLHANL